MSVSRNVGIAMAFSAMKKLGVGVVVDFTVKSLMPNLLMEHICQAACLIDVNRWVLQLPIASISEDPPKILDELTVIRIPTIPILENQEKGEHISESEQESYENDLGTGVDPVLSEQIIRQVCGRDYGVDIEGWGI